MSSPISQASAEMPALSRRDAVLGGAAGLAALALPRPALAENPALPELIARITDGVVPVRRGVTVDVPPVSESGNAVDLAIRIDSPMSEADHIKWVHVIADKNPYPDIARFHLGPRAGRADVAATIRLGASQNVTVVAATSAGGYLIGDAPVVVTLSACIDGG